MQVWLAGEIRAARESVPPVPVSQNTCQRGGAEYTAQTPSETALTFRRPNLRPPRMPKSHVSRTPHTKNKQDQTRNKRAHNTRPPRARRFIPRACGADNSRRKETRGHQTRESLSELYYETASTQPISLGSVASVMRALRFITYAISSEEYQ